MHKDFAEWYRSAGIEPNGETLPKRWAAIEEYEVGPGEVVSLTQLFYQVGEPSEEFIAAFRAPFQKADAAFPMRGNDRELVVLAGAKLVDAIERAPRDVADLAALSLICAAAQNLRPNPAVAEIPEVAARYLSKRATSRALPDKESSGRELVEALINVGTPYDLLAAEFQKLQLELPIVAEETNMLWWLVSEHSRDLNQPWRKLPVSAVCLVAGKELADLTRVIPGPIAATAFLDRVIRSGRTECPTAVLISDAVNETPVEWRQEYEKKSYPSELEDIVPISHGIKLSLSAPDKDTWLPMFAKATGISIDSKSAPHTLAYQMFLETLVCRTFTMPR